MITTKEHVERQSGKTLTASQINQVNWAIINVTGSIIGFLNNDFRTDTEYDAETISFAGNTISDSANGFGDFVANDFIEVCGSLRNNGWYRVATAAAGSLVLKTELMSPELLVTEAAGESVTVYMLQTPRGLERVAINMVLYDVFTRNKTNGMESETVGTYTYAKMVNIGGQEYPDEIVGGLKNPAWNYLRLQ